MTYMLEIEELRKVAHAAIGPVLDELVACVVQGDASLLDERLNGSLAQLGDRLARAAYAQIGAGLRARQRRGETPACPQCGQHTRFKQSRSLTVRTALTGSGLKVSSPYSICESCRLGVYELRDALRLDSDGLTPTLRALAISAGTLEPFEAASTQLLERFAGVTLSGSKIHQLCVDAGERLAGRMDDEALGEITPLGSAERLNVQIDGGMLHIGGEWREAKLAVIFPQSAVADISKDRRALTSRHVVFTLGTRKELGQRILRVVERYVPCDPDGAPLIRGRVHVIGDGAEWIANLVSDDLPGASYMLDWYHVAEHIGQASRVLYPNERGRRWWVGKQKNLLKNGHVAAMLQGLQHQKTRYASETGEHIAITDLHRYLSNRAEQLWYAKARREHLHVGSGIVESANSHVLQQRMKRTGMHWEARGANAMAALRCTYRTGGLKLLAQAA